MPHVEDRQGNSAILHLRCVRLHVFSNKHWENSCLMPWDLDTWWLHHSVRLVTIITWQSSYGFLWLKSGFCSRPPMQKKRCLWTFKSHMHFMTMLETFSFCSSTDWSYLQSASFSAHLFKRGTHILKMCLNAWSLKVLHFYSSLKGGRLDAHETWLAKPFPARNPFFPITPSDSAPALPTGDFRPLLTRLPKGERAEQRTPCLSRVRAHAWLRKQKRCLLLTSSARRQRQPEIPPAPIPAGDQNSTFPILPGEPSA